ncbi:hypothetical protein [Pseudosulfitobacter koreensis]|uniref:Uncharacterized protein n=1 Tax=Pseudosulfitobacter koreensis TaxID=2968472 RepID=A0ABT1Z0L4_9RHOB|nr:hypothetical protein [Pseudosulfitobacter koreense]MCR8826657.1 hypothetical protein [Pseudosulfitobacter koreense]
MPLDRLVLIIVCVIAAAGATIWLALLVLATFTVPQVGVALLPVALIAYVLIRLIRERVGNPTEDHYDNMDH